MFPSVSVFLFFQTKYVGYVEYVSFNFFYSKFRRLCWNTACLFHYCQHVKSLISDRFITFSVWVGLLDILLTFVGLLCGSWDPNSNFDTDVNDEVYVILTFTFLKLKSFPSSICIKIYCWLWVPPYWIGAENGLHYILSLFSCFTICKNELCMANGTSVAAFRFCKFVSPVMRS